MSKNSNRNKSKKRKRNMPKAKPLFPSSESKYDKLKSEVKQQSENISKQQEGLKQFQKTLDALSKSHANHLSLLSNFARHDLKNYIHSIDGIVSTCDEKTIKDSQLESIRLNVKFIRNTLDEFAKLVVHDKDSNCEFEDLVTAINIINRTSFAENNIKFQVENSVDITFHIPFTIMFQLLNNLIGNSIKAFENYSSDNKTVELKAYIDSENLIIEVSDNGRVIESAHKDKLFDYGFSKTDGTGIGLYHARYSCELNNGSIEYYDRSDSELSKCFVISLPITKE